MKAIVTILDNKSNVVEKDKVILPVKSWTKVIKGEGDDKMLINKCEFCFCYSIMRTPESEEAENE